jgi:AraC-like DNA-binding protein
VTSRAGVDVRALRCVRRARDTIDRNYAEQLPIAALAADAGYSLGQFIRVFEAAYGETPGQYRSRRRVERACELLRSANLTVTEVCMAVGFTSLGTFSRTFREIVGESPRDYRRRGPSRAVPTCFTMAWTRPSSFGEAAAASAR